MKSPEDPLLIRLKTRLARWRVALLLAVSGAALLALAGLVMGGWYFSDQIRGGALEPDRDPDEPDLEVVALREEQVTLHATEKANENGDWRKDGIFGLEWQRGYGQVGAIREIDDQQVVRQFFPLQGALEIGDLARLDSFAFPGDPEQAHGIPFQEVTFASELGEFPAWFVDGPRHTWVIFVHGKGASRREALRMLPTVTDLGFPSLIITYRNDVEALAGPDGFYRYGKTEWEDLEAAADYAVQQGADALILVGYSMGGAIVVNFLLQSPLAERVHGAILDAPMLDFNAILALEARERGAPGLLTEVGKALADFRWDIGWGELNYLSRADDLGTPILLFHGDADDVIPVETSDALAEARPDIVTYVRVAGAGHVRSWNAGPEAYEATVRDFLEKMAE